MFHYSVLISKGVHNLSEILPISENKSCLIMYCHYEISLVSISMCAYFCNASSECMWVPLQMRVLLIMLERENKPSFSILRGNEIASAIQKTLEQCSKRTLWCMSQGRPIASPPAILPSVSILADRRQTKDSSVFEFILKSQAHLNAIRMHWCSSNAKPKEQNKYTCFGKPMICCWILINFQKQRTQTDEFIYSRSNALFCKFKGARGSTKHVQHKLWQRNWLDTLKYRLKGQRLKAEGTSVNLTRYSMQKQAVAEFSWAETELASHC